MRRQHKAGLSGIAMVLAAGCVTMMAAEGRAGILVDFEDLEAGTRFLRGESFMTDGVVISVPAGGARGLLGGEVTANGQAGGDGNELELHGLIRFDFSEPLISLSFQFYASQILMRTGEIPIEIDLDQPATAVMIDNLRATTSGVSGTGRVTGMASIEATTGTFDSIFLGTSGERSFLIIDNMNLVVPEPGIPLSVGMMSVVLLMRRRR